MLKNSSILYSMYDTCAGTCIYIVPIAKGWNGCVRNLKLPALLRAMFYVFSKKKFLNMYWILQFWSLLNIRIHDSSIFCNVQMILKKTRGKFIKPHRFWCESPITCSCIWCTSSRTFDINHWAKINQTWVKSLYEMIRLETRGNIGGKIQGFWASKYSIIFKQYLNWFQVESRRKSEGNWNFEA